MSGTDPFAAERDAARRLAHDGRRWLRRWGECAVAAGLLALGLALWTGVFSRYGAGTTAGGIVGLGLAVVGLGWLIAALPRARLAGAADPAPGIVAVREGAVGFFGPFDGGVIALDDLVRVEVTGAHQVRPGAMAMVPALGGTLEIGGAWRLIAADGTVLRVPAGARGVGQLVEALIVLPGFRAAEAQGILDAPPAARPGDAVVWTRPGATAPLRPG
ncbi:MAG: hypothetical protein AAFP23_04465 [Pseudomonadota bacterium]